jgi:hypothetical protein
MDIIYIVITLIFFALSWGLVKTCDRLSPNANDGKREV